MLFDVLPIELNYKIFEYYNCYQQDHQLTFKDTINQINQFPKFIRKFKQRDRRGFIIYYNFISCKGVHYLIEEKNYFQTFQNAIKLTNSM
jgi:hypothetical protein